MIVRICLNEHKPHNFQYLRYQENKFRADDHTPTLRICHPIAVHETSDPDDEGYDGEFPEVDKWNGEIFDTVEYSQHRPLWPILQELKSSGFIFNK